MNENATDQSDDHDPDLDESNLMKQIAAEAAQWVAHFRSGRFGPEHPYYDRDVREAAFWKWFFRSTQHGEMFMSAIDADLKLKELGCVVAESVKLPEMPSQEGMLRAVDGRRLIIRFGSQYFLGTVLVGTADVRIEARCWTPATQDVADGTGEAFGPARTFFSRDALEIVLIFDQK